MLLSPGPPTAAWPGAGHDSSHLRPTPQSSPRAGRPDGAEWPAGRCRCEPAQRHPRLCPAPRATGARM